YLYIFTATGIPDSLCSFVIPPLALITSLATGWLVVLVVLVGSVTSASAGRRRSVDTDKGSSSPRPIDDVDDFVPYQGKRYDHFDWRLFQSLAKRSSGSLLVSPISLKFALVLLYEGADNNTARELATAMNITDDKLKTRDRFANVLKSMKEKRPEFSLNFGSRFYVDHSVTLRQRYVATAETFYKAQVLNANFSNSPATAEKINSFVNNVTEGHIPRLITNDETLRDSLMVIVNALYFKGQWYRQPFDASHTRSAEFHTATGQSVQVPYMMSTKKLYLGFIKDLDSKILRLPYAGHKYSMFVILPQQPGNLSDLVGKIQPDKMSEYEWLMQEIPVDVRLPKFKFDFTSHMEDALRELGINEIFDETATLTGILRSKSTSRPLVVNDILQKSGIEVNEQGSTAYTATEIEIGTKMNDETFHATHPFVFYIKDESTGTILYMGTYMGVDNSSEKTGMAKVSTEPTPMAPMNLKIPAAPTSAAVGTGRIERTNYFNIELLQQVNEAQPGNVVIGTSTVKAALVVLAEAATGKTQQEILSSLRITDFSDTAKKASNLTATNYKDPTGDTELQTAIKLWTGKNVDVRQNYSNAVHSFYGGEIEKVDFSNSTATVKAVNEWITKYTHGRITSLTDPSSITDSTNLLLTTSAYFKGKWEHAFDKADTRKRCFNVPDLGCKDVAMMEIVADYKYAVVPSLVSEAVFIPYTGGRMGMLMLLPLKTGMQALADLSRDMAFTPVSSVLAAMQDTELLLQIPRFSIGTKLNMQGKLSELNIKSLFGDDADLSAAFLGKGVKVGAFMHNAHIEINEEGTIAAAVSEAVVIPLMGSTTTRFRADRPFLFFLLDLEKNDILFAGRYHQPDDTAKLN
ncbi:uncharacterized protein LOC106647876, partial [Copidosoma floridanum]|uniref:uncharacterized protein LOC106647876 n=1 Tax=Copidosoma floridanum TaxID=29053 RepID=UPI000C6FB0AB